MPDLLSPESLCWGWGLQRLLTVRETREEERRGAEEEKERKGRRTGLGGGIGSKKNYQMFFCFRCPCLPKLPSHTFPPYRYSAPPQPRALLGAL